MQQSDRPGLSRATPHAPVFASDETTLVLSSTRDEQGERVVLVTWHQGAPAQSGNVTGNDNDWTGQLELTELDAARLRDFLDGWLALVPPPEPREAA